MVDECGDPERFGREMETLLGAAARHPTANMDAVSACRGRLRITKPSWTSGNG